MNITRPSREDFRNIKAALTVFFEGRLYPLLVAAAVLIGHVTALEFYFCIPILITATMSLYMCDTIRPFLITLTTFVYQITFKHTPGEFSYPYLPDGDYYLQPHVIIIIGLLGIGLFSGMIYRFIRLSAGRLTPRRAPLLYPICVLCGALLLGGIFSAGYTAASLLYGIAQCLVFFFLFYLVYFGLEGLSSSELMSYLSYLSLLIAMVLVGEVAFVYLTYDNLIVNGTIIKEAINLGWGVTNPIGFSLTALLPALAWGAMNERHPALYFTAMLLTFGAAFATLSRNAMLFSSFTLLILLIFGCFIGKRQRFFRIAALVFLVLGALMLIVLWDKIMLLLSNLLGRDGGIANDNGRFELWRRALSLFASAPLFGVGFFSFGDIGTSTYISFLPPMAHNTLLILLCSCGILGLGAYIYYRVSTLCPLLRRPSSQKSILLISLLVILSMSLLDNFVFYFYTMFYYTVILAISQISVKQEQTDGEA